MISGNAAGIGIANLALGGSFMVTPVAGSVVQNDLIGTDATGVGNLGNSIAGVAILGSGNVVGGTAPGEANTIAFNGKAGAVLNLGVGIVVVALDQTPNVPISVPSTGDLISGNSIFSNHNLGIGLLDVPTSTLLPLINISTDNLPTVISNFLTNLNLGVTPNDHLDAHTGPNNLQNFPDLASAVTGNGVTTVRGTLDSTPNTSFTIQFFSSPTANATGYGEGQVFLGETIVQTDANGIAPVVFTPSAAVPVGQVIAATAIDPGNNTSEFSKAVTVTPEVVATGPHVVRVQRFGIRAQPRSIVLTFDQPLDSLRAGNAGNYSLALLTQSRRSPVPRETPIPITSAVYDPAALTVTLTPRRSLTVQGRYLLTVRGTGTGVADLNGNLLDGNNDGIPGGNFTTILRRTIPIR